MGNRGVGPKTCPDTITPKEAGAALVIGFVKKGATDDKVVNIATTGSDTATGYVDVAVAITEIASVIGDDSIVEVIWEGTVAYGDDVTSGNGINTCKTAVAGTNVVGMAMDGGATGTTGHVRLQFRRL